MKKSRKAAPRRNRGWLWITRDGDSRSGYRVWRAPQRPTLKVTSGWGDGAYNVEWKGRGLLIELCQDGFEHVMQFRLPPGACEKVRITLESVFGIRRVR